MKKNWIPWLIVAVLAIFIASDKLFFDRQKSERHEKRIQEIQKSKDSLLLLIQIDSLVIEQQANDLLDADEVFATAKEMARMLDSLYGVELKKLNGYKTTNDHARIKNIILWRNARPAAPDSI